MTATAEPNAASHLSVPAAALELGFSLDKLRALIRERADLRELFSLKLGPARGIPVSRLPELRTLLNLPPE